MLFRSEEDLATDTLLNFLQDKGKVAENGQGVVTLLSAPEKPEEVPAAAVAERFGYDAPSVAKDTAFQEKVLDFLFASSRKRELEQIAVTVKFHGVSMSGLTHLLRHRMQSILPPHYVSQADFTQYVLPQSVVEAGLQQEYDALFVRSGALFAQMKAAGMEESELGYLLLSGLQFPVVTTMNGRELLLFLGMRTCERSQWEIREEGNALLTLLQERNPRLFSRFGPKCFVDGYCSEGKMTCGRREAIREEGLARAARLGCGGLEPC